MSTYSPSGTSLSPQFKDALEAQRESLNQRFRTLQKLGTKIDPSEFQAHVLKRIGPIADAVHAYLPERLRTTVSDLADVSFDLFASNHLGNASKSKWMDQLWARVFPRAAQLIARDPSRSVGCLANGLIHIENYSEESAGRWLDLLERAIDACHQTDEWLVAGKIAAWLSGMVQYRREAISLARSLRPPIVRSLLALPESTSDSVLNSELAGFESDPWHSLQIESPTEATQIERVKICCQFRGWGGVFMTPPQAAVVDGHLMVTDGTHVWQLLSDRYGWMTLRNEMEPSFLLKLAKKPIKSHRSADAPILKADGTIIWGSDTRHDPELAGNSSASYDGRTFAVTIPTSFHVFLFAKTSQRGVDSTARGQ